ncbi:LLM class flavin-dependent oxidoreductase [Streptomyces sp. TRM 70361]|uniref:LLM class flavin-dependent oxidoreductase n=1 Tax=Streptomyces sp. TRM 70361 TaxID=3116553 RepID=UPI002E7C240E|nr:LLM class flavin-dependent oxidoreductase [Streptomyces sp. TRM 70361]MEE1942841.1 LLM class flavin-dependent oxidoreductase [Streptomyces sp. TRM 70361]
MVSLGVVFRPQLPPERLRSVARAAEEAGLEQLWLWEDCFLESGIAAASAALAWTERLRVGVGLLPVPLRNVALTAMEAATVHRMFPGRAVLAVGHGVQDWMGQVGARAESPLTLLREYTDALRGLLRGERLTVDGRYVRLDGVALGWPPPQAPAVLGGASGPRSLRLVAEAADGAVLTAGNPPEAVRRMRRMLDGTPPPEGGGVRRELVVYLHAATGPDADARMRAELEAFGDAPETAATGDAATVAAAVRRLAAAGADTVVLQPAADEPDVEGFIRFAAGEVRPLVG